MPTNPNTPSIPRGKDQISYRELYVRNRSRLAKIILSDIQSIAQTSKDDQAEGIEHIFFNILEIDENFSYAMAGYSEYVGTSIPLYGEESGSPKRKRRSASEIKEDLNKLTPAKKLGVIYAWIIFDLVPNALYGPSLAVQGLQEEDEEQAQPFINIVESAEKLNEALQEKAKSLTEIINSEDALQKLIAQSIPHVSGEELKAEAVQSGSLDDWTIADYVNAIDVLLKQIPGA